MLLLQLLPVILSLLVLAAHFMRYGQTVLVVLSVAVIGLLAVPRRWAVRVVQVVLLLGGAEWMRAMIILTRIRAEHGQPAGRLIVILTTVALVTVASAAVFYTRRARSRFQVAVQESPGEPPQ